MKVSADYRRQAREALRGKWTLASKACAFLMLLSFAISAIISLAPRQIQVLEIGGQYYSMTIQGNVYTLAERYPLLALLYLALYGLQPALYVGLFHFFVRLVDGETPEPTEALSGFSRFWRALWLYVQMVVRIFLWSLLLVIPGIIAYLRYSQAPHILGEYPDMTASQAMAESSRRMDGYKWQLFCLEFSFIGWVLLGGLIIGATAALLPPLVAALVSCLYSLFFLMPYITAAQSAFYRDRFPLEGQFQETADSEEYRNYDAQ